MSVLKRKLALFAVAFVASVPARAEPTPLVSGLEATLNGASDTGTNHAAGSAIEVRLGSEEDETSFAATLRGNYTGQFSLADPTVADSGLRQVANWGGGAAVTTWKGGTIAIDLDRISDPDLNLFTDGTKLSVGHGIFTASFRFARNVLRDPFTALITPTTFATFKGAFIYQKTAELTADLSLGENHLFAPKVNFSWFSPDAAQFADLVSRQALQSLSSFQDTLQSLEQWAVGAEWKAKWGSRWDTRVSATLSHLIIPANPLIATQLAVGYQLTKGVHAEVGWEYSHDPLNLSSMGTFELRFAWERAEKDEESGEADKPDGAHKADPAHKADGAEEADEVVNDE